jgi:hypothetical protein
MPDTAERIRALILDAAAELWGAAHVPAGYNEYGSVVTPGYKVEASNRPGTVRVEHVLPESDLSDPNRMSGAERYEARHAARDAYAATLEAAGWVVEKRMVLGIRPILSAARPKGDPS